MDADHEGVRFGAGFRRFEWRRYTPFVVRIRCVDGAKIPAHWHPTDESVTVLKGTFLVGMGETFDESKLQTMNVGNFISMPKEIRHFAMSKARPSCRFTERARSK